MLATPNNYDNNNNPQNINENNELNDSKRDLLIINQNQQPNVKQEGLRCCHGNELLRKNQGSGKRTERQEC